MGVHKKRLPSQERQNDGSLEGRRSRGILGLPKISCSVRPVCQIKQVWAFVLKAVNVPGDKFYVMVSGLVDTAAVGV